MIKAIKFLIKEDKLLALIHFLITTNILIPLIVVVCIWLNVNFLANQTIDDGDFVFGILITGLVSLIAYAWVKLFILSKYYEKLIINRPDSNLAKKIKLISSNKKMQSKVLKNSLLLDLLNILAVSIILVYPNYFGHQINIFKEFMFVSVIYLLAGGGLFLCYWFLFKWWRITNKNDI